MLRFIKGLVVAFVISFLVFVFPVSAQATDGNPHTAMISVRSNSKSLSVETDFTVVNNSVKFFLESDAKADAVKLAEAKRIANNLRVEFLCTWLSFVCVLGVLVFSTYIARKRKKMT